MSGTITADIKSSSIAGTDGRNRERTFPVCLVHHADLVTTAIWTGDVGTEGRGSKACASGEWAQADSFGDGLRCGSPALERESVTHYPDVAGGHECRQTTAPHSPRVASESTAWWTSKCTRSARRGPVAGKRAGQSVARRSLPNWVCPLQTVLSCKRWISSAIGLSRSSTFGIGKSRVPAAGASDLLRVIPTPPHAHARSGDRRRPWCSRSPPGREQERMELSQQVLLRVRRRPRYVLSIRHQTTRPSWRPTDVPAGLTRSEGYCGHRHYR